MDSDGVCTTGVVSVIPVFIRVTGLSVESVTRDNKVSNAIDRPVTGAVLMLLLLVYQ